MDLFNAQRDRRKNEYPACHTLNSKFRNRVVNEFRLPLAVLEANNYLSTKPKPTRMTSAYEIISKRESITGIRSIK